MKSLPKSKSITNDTLLSRSHIFPASFLNHPTSQPKENPLSYYISSTEHQQISFIRLKNKQLQTKLKAMASQIQQLSLDKSELLSVNQQYVSIINKFHENEKIRTQSNSQHNIFCELQRDYRNLVDFCKIMEKERKGYVEEVEKFLKHKAELKKVNHTDVTELIAEIVDLAEQNKNLKKQNNRLSFELEKSLEEYEKLKRNPEEFDNNEKQLRMIINSTNQKNADKINQYETKIYELQLKNQRLQNELRAERAGRNEEKKGKKVMQMREIEYIHEKERLEEDIERLKKDKIIRQKSIKGGMRRGRKEEKKERKSFYL